MRWACGPLAGELQTVPRGELQAAVYLAQRVARGPVVLFADSQFVYDGAQGTPGSGIDSLHGELWAEFWRHFA
eukprot:1927791-Lingulodinium_polyedra.AAC.1